jgi:hypothetical protein
MMMTMMPYHLSPDPTPKNNSNILFEDEDDVPLLFNEGTNPTSPKPQISSGSQPNATAPHMKDFVFLSLMQDAVPQHNEEDSPQITITPCVREGGRGHDVSFRLERNPQGDIRGMSLTAGDKKLHIRLFSHSNSYFSESTPMGTTMMINSQPILTERELTKSIDDDGNKVLNGYVMLVTLGKGAYGKVKLALDIERNVPVAVKILNRKTLSKTIVCPSHRPTLLEPVVGTVLGLVHKEIEIMTKLRHPNLVRLKKVLDDDSSDKLYLIMEYMSGGTLRPTDSLATIRKQFLDILHGLLYLHQKNIVHMDSKARQHSP